MPVNILIVDDSAIIRGLISKALSADSRIVIAGSASTGAMGIKMAKTHQPDIIILDVEMPEMDGLTALPEILKVAPDAKVIVASTLSTTNAEISIDALTLGAVDCIAKPSSKEKGDVDKFYNELLFKVKTLSGFAESPAVTKTDKTPAAPIAQTSPSKPPVLAKSNPQIVQALAIASSTGGPQALVKVFEDIVGKLNNIPIFITQHMPPNFTTILAQHITKSGKRTCHEATSGMKVEAGHVYLAPGDYHMLIEKEADGKGHVIKLTKDAPENFCRPAADPMLRSLSDIYGSGLAVLVLTGMGQDGYLGCKQVIEKGGSVIAQDKDTSVVYGMPKAVADAGLCKAILPLAQIGQHLIRQIDGGRNE